jgi:hypothetical protein
MALSTACMVSSDSGLSATITSSGLLEDGRTRPQLPSLSSMRTPFTVIRPKLAARGWQVSLWTGVALDWGRSPGRFLLSLDGRYWAAAAAQPISRGEPC